MLIGHQYLFLLFKSGNLSDCILVIVAFHLTGVHLKVSAWNLLNGIKREIIEQTIIRHIAILLRIYLNPLLTNFDTT